MKEKNARQVTNVTNGVVFGKSVLTQGCGGGVTNEREKTPLVSPELGVEEVPDLEILTIDANARCPLLNFELKVRGDGHEILEAVGKAAGKPNLQLEIRASIKDNYGETVPASWKCRGRSRDIPTTFMPTTTLKLSAHFYEHIINDEEIYHIDRLNDIRRIYGVDQLEAVREALGI